VNILSSLPVVSGKALVNYLCRNGYYVKRTHGSHHFCVRKDGKGAPLDIPVHGNNDIAKGTLSFIITVFARNESLSEEDARELLRKNV